MATRASTRLGKLLERFETRPEDWSHAGSSIGTATNLAFRGFLLVRTCFRDVHGNAIVLVQYVSIDASHPESPSSWGYFRPLMEGEAFGPVAA